MRRVRAGGTPFFRQATPVRPTAGALAPHRLQRGGSVLRAGRRQTCRCRKAAVRLGRALGECRSACAVSRRRVLGCPQQRPRAAPRRACALPRRLYYTRLLHLVRCTMCADLHLRRVARSGFLVLLGLVSLHRRPMLVLTPLVARCFLDAPVNHRLVPRSRVPAG